MVFFRVIIHPNCNYMIIIQKRIEVWRLENKIDNTTCHGPVLFQRARLVVVVVVVVVQKMQALVSSSMLWKNDKGITCVWEQTVV